MTVPPSQSEFIELGVYRTSDTENEQKENTTATSEVIADVSSQSSHEPQIIVHRKGNIVESLEFRCTCGKSTIVHLQYDGE